MEVAVLKESWSKKANKYCIQASQKKINPGRNLSGNKPGGNFIHVIILGLDGGSCTQGVPELEI